MYPKNAASPPPVFATVVAAADGSPITSGVAAKYSIGANQAAAGGTCRHEGNGQWSYTANQAESNVPSFGIQFYHANAVGTGPSVTVVTDQGYGAVIDAILSGLSALSTFDPANDAVILADANHGGANATLTLSSYSNFKATGFSTHSAADVATALGNGAALTDAGTAIGAAVVVAIQANAASFKADVSGLSTFNAANDKVTLANGAHGGSGASFTLTDYSAFKATGFSTHSADDVKTAIEANGSKLNDLHSMTEAA